MPQFRKLLLVITGDSDPGPAFRQALELASASGGEITLLDIADPVPEEARSLISAPTLAAMEMASMERRTSALLDLAAGAESAGVPVLKRMVSGAPFRVAIRAVLAEGHDLLIKARDTERSTDKHLLRKCPCPVWLCGADELAAGAAVLSAVNPDPAEPEDQALSVSILEQAAAVAVVHGCALDVLHAWRVFGERLLGGANHLVPDAEVADIMDKARNRHADLVRDLVARLTVAGISPRTHLIHARPADAIIDFVNAHPVRLLVMGTVGRTGVPGLLIGNTAERVLDEIACPVLALKPQGFVSPVADG